MTPSAPEGLAGIDGAGVRDLEAAGLTAWVSDVSGPVDATVDRLKAHDAVCAAAMNTGDTPLPIRFGQTFDDDAAARQRSSNASGAPPRLTRVAGRAECESSSRKVETTE